MAGVIDTRDIEILRLTYQNARLMGMMNASSSGASADEATAQPYFSKGVSNARAGNSRPPAKTNQAPPKLNAMGRKLKTANMKKTTGPNARAKKPSKAGATRSIKSKAIAKKQIKCKKAAPAKKKLSTKKPQRLPSKPKKK